MKKVIENGNTMVLVKGDYGGGWSTWNKDFPECVFDPVVVDLVRQYEAGTISDVQFMDAVYDHCTKTYGDRFYATADITSLCVVPVPVGSRFVIQEYDGLEALIREDDMKWVTA